MPIPYCGSRAFTSGGASTNNDTKRDRFTRRRDGFFLRPRRDLILTLGGGTEKWWQRLHKSGILPV